MASEKKIIAIVGEVDFKHPYFRHLKPDEKADVIDAYERGVSIPIAFVNEKKEVIFYTFFDPDDFYKDGLHVHLLLGNFLKYYKFIAAFFEGMAKSLKKNRVTYCTKRRAIFTLGQNMGYSVNNYGDLEKVLI